jgi:protein disulfide-isomerase
MMKRLLIVFLVSTLVLVQARTWTSAEGKTLEAELVRVKDGKAYLKLAKNRQIHPLDIVKLSIDDQSYIKAYEQEQTRQLEVQALQERKVKWHENYADAKAEAERFNLPILLLYTAPEWCGYCVKLEDRVFKTSEFKRFSKGNLVLLIADFSEERDKKEWMKENSILADQFKASGYPCTYFISTDLKKLGKLGGYEDDWSTKIYIEKMGAIIKK